MEFAFERTAPLRPAPTRDAQELPSGRTLALAQRAAYGSESQRYYVADGRLQCGA